MTAMVVLAAACGGSTSASTSPSASPPSPTPPVAEPSVVPAAEPISQWDAPGSASLAQTAALAGRFAKAQTGETVPDADLYAAAATFDYWASGEIHTNGDVSIGLTYSEAGGTGRGDGLDWTKPHVLVGPGVVVYEGTLQVRQDKVSFPYLELLAVDGTTISHEEVFLDPGPKTKRPVTYEPTRAGQQDTAKVAADVAASVGSAFAAGDAVALAGLLAPDVLFYDTELRHGTRGADAVLAWQRRTPTIQVENQQPIAGPGWAVVRWTVRQVSGGVETAMPGATVMEVRNGKAVRMTLYYDSDVISLQT